jgi:DNA-binding NarL/FixJ family response regulator
MYSTSSFEFDADGQLYKTITMVMDVTREINTNQVLTQYIRTSLHSQYEDLYRLLSKGEIEVINLTVQGKSTKEIAAELFLSHHTIESHKSNIFKKLDIGSSIELAQLAEKIGLLIEKI